MKIAIEGCCHGELDAIYTHMSAIEHKTGKVDLLLICGDFQAIRNASDLQCMAVPPKYRRLGEFYKYYTGENRAPVLTVVIGGNHEASNYMWELYHGGWLAPNIYFLGHAGVVNVDGVRIAGVSGIFKPGDYRLGHFERMPYDNRSMRSIYHIREYNVARLSMLSRPDIFLSHDWPQGIEQNGNTADLLKRKPHFRQEAESNTLGSPPLLRLLQKLQPKYWFSAHLHCRFEAAYVHGLPDGRAKNRVSPFPSLVKKGADKAKENPDEIMIEDDVDEGQPATSQKNQDEIVMDDEQLSVRTAEPFTPSVEPSMTRFLALDKCLPRRQFLEVTDIPSSGGPITLKHDPEWLAITRALHPYLTLSAVQKPIPDPETASKLVDTERAWIQENVGDGKDVLDVQQFCMTTPGPGRNTPDPNRQPPWFTNPQTEAFCKMIGVENRINPPPKGARPRQAPVDNTENVAADT